MRDPEEYPEQELNEPDTWTDEDQDEWDDYQQELEDRAMER